MLRFLLVLLMHFLLTACQSSQNKDQKITSKNKLFQNIGSCNISEFENIRKSNNFTYNEISQNGVTLLMVAAFRNQKECFSHLLGQGADQALLDERQRTALFYAIEGRSVEVAEILIKKKKLDLNRKDSFELTPLMVASNLGLNQTVELLIAEGADPNIVDENGWSSLFFASAQGNLEIVKTLVRNGAKVKALDNEGLSPYKIAYDRLFFQVSDYLMSQE